MPEIAEAPAGEQSVVDNPAFGNLGEAFDAAFPSTAPKEGEERAPEPPVAPRKPTPPVEPVAPVKPKAAEPARPTLEHEVPDSIFSDPTPAPEPVKPAEPETFKGPKELRTAYDSTKRELAEKTVALTKLEEKLKTPPKDEGAVARIAELEARNAELSDRMAAVDLQSHPAFQAKFVQPRAQLLGSASNLLKSVDKDPAALESAMALTGKQRIQALDNLFDDIESPTVRSKVAGVVDQIDAIDEQKAAVLADAKGSYERLTKMTAAQRHQQAQEQTAQLNKVFDAAVEHLRDKVGFEVLKEVDGVDWWNQQGKTAIEAARKLMFENDNPEQMAAASVLAATSGIHRGLWLKERTQRVELAKELAAIKDGEPNLRGNSDRGADDDGDDKLTFAERVAKGSGLR